MLFEQQRVYMYGKGSSKKIQPSLKTREWNKRLQIAFEAAWNFALQRAASRFLSRKYNFKSPTIQPRFANAKIHALVHGEARRWCSCRCNDGALFPFGNTIPPIGRPGFLRELLLSLSLSLQRKKKNFFSLPAIRRTPSYNRPRVIPLLAICIPRDTRRVRARSMGEEVKRVGGITADFTVTIAFFYPLPRSPYRECSSYPLPTKCLYIYIYVYIYTRRVCVQSFSFGSCRKKVSDLSYPRAGGARIFSPASFLFLSYPFHVGRCRKKSILYPPGLDVWELFTHVVCMYMYGIGSLQ